MTANRFESKIILVTGGNSGIGLATARRLATEGATVIISGRNRETLDRAMQHLGERAQGIKVDMTRVSEIEELYAQVKEKFGRLDGLFANAGIAITEAIENVNEQNLDAMINTNIKGTFFTLQKAIPLLSQGAAIVITGSATDTKGPPLFAVYAATKAAVRSMARTFSSTLIERGIRVNVVSPGPIETAIWEGFDAGVVEQRKQANPSRRFGKPEEVASAVAYLLSPESSYIVGAELYIDGGAGQL